MHSVFGKINYGGLKHNSLYLGLVLPSGGWQSLIKTFLKIFEKTWSISRNDTFRQFKLYFFYFIQLIWCTKASVSFPSVPKVSSKSEPLWKNWKDIEEKAWVFFLIIFLDNFNCVLFYLTHFRAVIKMNFTTCFKW